MATIEQRLSTRQKELVAIGASIGVGCHPCISHHLHAGADAGLEPDQLLAATASAERVTAEAAVHMGDHVRDTLGPDVEPALLSRLEETLASLGGALAANDKTNIERHLRTATKLGISREQLLEAIETARAVQENASRIHVREAERLLGTLAAPSPPSPDKSCGCGAADTAAPSEGCTETQQAKQASEEAAATEAAAGTRAAGCSPTAGEAGPDGLAAMMAAFCGPGGPAVAMEKCRDMFGPASAESAAAAPATAPPESSAAGGDAREEARQ